MNQIYQNIFNKHKHLIESSYKRKSRYIRNSIILFVILMFLIIYVFDKAYVSLYVAIFYLVFSVFVYSYKRDKLALKYKKTVMPDIVKSIDENIIYRADQGFSKSYFTQIGLYNDNIDSYTASDYIQHKIGSTNIKFCHVNATRTETERDSDGDTHSTTYTVFKGSVIELSFNKFFTGKTKIFSQGAHLNVETASSTWFSAYDDIVMDNMLFNNVFQVITTDKQQAYYILSTSFMESLIQLYNKYPKGLSIAFDSNVMIICIEHIYFIHLFIDKKEMIKDIIATHKSITKILNLVDDLNLNNRIWTKK